MPGLAQAALLLHVFSALAFAAGYVGTNLLTEIARRSDDAALRRSALAFSKRFDRALNAPGGTAASITGLLAVWALGYSFLTPWIVASIAIWLVIMALGIVYWRRFGGAVEAALASGDEARVVALLRQPRSVRVSRFENLALVTLVALMVLRPGI